MSEGNFDKNAITGLYAGLQDKGSFSRGVLSCEAIWNEELNIGTFDQLVTEQLLLAEKEGRDEVLVVDVGSGDIGLFSSFLNDSTLSAQTRKFLTKHPNFKIKMIGLTEAPNPDSLLKQAPSRKIESYAEHDQITLENVYYSLTTNQTLARFLEQKNIAQADIILSTWALTYLGPNTFSRLLVDVLEKLRPHGGKFVGASYAEQDISGFKRIEKGFPHDLDVRDIDKNVSSVKGALGDSTRPFRFDVDLNQEVKMLREAELQMLNLGVLSAEEIQDAEQEFQESIQKWGADQIASWIDRRKSRTTELAAERLAIRKIDLLKNRKLEILQKLKNERSEDYDISFTDTVILIKKK